MFDDGAHRVECRGASDTLGATHRIPAHGGRAEITAGVHRDAMTLHRHQPLAEAVITAERLDLCEHQRVVGITAGVE